MAQQTITTTARVRFRKEHACVNCGGRFAYVLEREASGKGPDEEAANLSLEAETNKILEEAVDLHPCPHCGAVQPEMASDVVRPRLLYSVIGGLAGLAFALVLGAADPSSQAGASWFACLASLGALGGCVWAASYRPYEPAALVAGWNTAAAETASGALLAGPPPPPDVVGTLTKAALIPPVQAIIGLGLCGAAALAALGPSVLATLFGWSMNSGCSPAVVGPGDVVRIYFDKSFDSIKGMWRGSAECEVTNADKLRSSKQWSAGTQNAEWGKVILGKRVKNSSNAMWVDATVPNDPNLVGRTAELRLSANVEFPFDKGFLKGFSEQEKSFTFEKSLRLSGGGAGRTYTVLWWLSLLAAFGCVFVGGGMMFVAARKFGYRRSTSRALPADAFPGAVPAA